MIRSKLPCFPRVVPLECSGKGDKWVCLREINQQSESGAKMEGNWHDNQPQIANMRMKGEGRKRKEPGVNAVCARQDALSRNWKGRDKNLQEWLVAMSHLDPTRRIHLSTMLLTGNKTISIPLRTSSKLVRQLLQQRQGTPFRKSRGTGVHWKPVSRLSRTNNDVLSGQANAINHWSQENQQSTHARCSTRAPHV